MSDEQDPSPSGSTMPGKGSDEDEPRWSHWVASASAVLLGLATVATAWSAYQANLWNGVMTTAFNEALQANHDAGKAYQAGDAVYVLDTSLFTDWATAVQSGNTELAAYLQDSLFSDQLVVATEAWLALPAAGSADAPASPFELPEYETPAWEQGDALEDQAVAKFEQAKAANQTADNFVMLTVVFASVLFLAGISSTLRSPRQRLAFTAIAGVVFLLGVVQLARYPIQ